MNNYCSVRISDLLPPLLVDYNWIKRLFANVFFLEIHFLQSERIKKKIASNCCKSTHTKYTGCVLFM